MIYPGSRPHIHPPPPPPIFQLPARSSVLCLSKLTRGCVNPASWLPLATSTCFSETFTQLLREKYALYRSVQSWPKKFVLGCVILPAGAVARSRNLGQTFLSNSVCMELSFSSLLLSLSLPPKKVVALDSSARNFGPPSLLQFLSTLFSFPSSSPLLFLVH